MLARSWCGRFEANPSWPFVGGALPFGRLGATALCRLGQTWRLKLEHQAFFVREKLLLRAKQEVVGLKQFLCT